MRCARCGNENPGENRFCGMCGATLLPAEGAIATAPLARSVASPAAPTAFPTGAAAPTPVIPVSAAPVPAAQSVTASRATVPESEERPIISGPSFLGLDQPAPRKKGSLSIDPQSAPSSGNLDYLLDDGEEPRRGGAGKYILIVVALALAVGLGYLRWKNQNFGWLRSGTSKPTAATQNTDAGDASAPAQSSGPPSGTSSETTASSSPPPASIQPATDAPSSAGSPAVNPGSGATPPAGTGATPDAGGSGSAPASTPGTQPAAANDSPPDAGDTPPPTTAKPKPAPVRATPKPPAASNATKGDPVSEAQKYLYGKGVRQDCDRALRILKPAADQANPKAMIEMGALYSAGLCTPRDLPTAYRWFALALRKQPDNQSVQTDLQKLWGEMTQPERQLAIKLSQ